MKNITMITTFLLLTSQISVPLTAERPGNPGAHKFEEKTQERTKKRLDMLTKKLRLSRDQQKVVKAAWESQRTKTDELRKDFAEKMKTIREDTDKQITAALNNDQKTKYTEMKAERKEKIQEFGRQKK
ncbi:MAG: hypothetical protein LHV69_02240 [Elusimicrobia bacterium]|nr:hypothetical protein [Candidatus Obscuribacterium magneticum]MCB4755846.1 hypothetical protein [Candidatus Obscuribacterium magneticum]